MEQDAPKTVVNQTLMLWCAVVIVELFVIAHLMASPMVLLFGLVLFLPLRAAMNWPAPVAAPIAASDAALDAPPMPPAAANEPPAR